MQRNAEAFASAIATQSLKQVDVAVALLWFRDHFLPGCEVSAAELGAEMHQLGLFGRVNTPRLGRQLAKHPHTVRGGAKARYKIALRSKGILDAKYLALLKQRRVTIVDDVVPESIVKGTRKYLERLAYQINACYSYELFDACAVLCRRVAEILLIEAFETAKQRTRIERNGELMMFGDIIKVAKSGRVIKLARATPKVLEIVKDVGDRAAHHRHHITVKQDIDEFKTGFRGTVSELLTIARIVPQ